MKRYNTKAEYPKDKTINELFEEQVKKTPGNIAVVYDDKQLTYRELNEKSNQLARILREKKIEPDTIVYLMVERSFEMVVGMIAVLKAGGAYLPVPPEYPEARKEFMFQDSGSKFLFTQNSLFYKNQKLAQNFSLENIFFLDNARIYSDEGSNPEISNGADNLAYVIYTSGTIGKPKGVMVSHRNAVNVLSWFGKQYHLQKDIHVLQLTDYSFDPSVEQIFGALLSGATLYLADQKWLADIRQLRRYIEENKINIVNFVPNVLDDLLGHTEKIESVEIVISGAEQLKDSIKNRIIAKGYALYNHYGPTETCIEVLTGKMSKQGVTLGKPIANTHCYIVDQQGNVAAEGDSGELWVTGAGVAMGYLNNPELTAEKFIKNPFSKEKKNLFFNRLYKTGDLVRQLPDGTIEFLGRIDHQVKIRGLRIEPGEIETHLLMHETIKEAVVIARENQSGEKYLCAYIIPHSSSTSTSKASRSKTSELRNYLSGLLPDYMIPPYFMKLDKLPLTPNGKVDLQALPEPGKDEGVKEYVPPRNEIEEKIAEIWSEILGIEKSKIGIDDDFYGLGGHSLKATMAIMEIYKKLRIKIPFSEMFKITTINGLALYIKKEALGEEYEPIEKGEKREFYPLSSAQERLYVLQQMDITSTGYNMPMIYVMEGKPNLQRIKETFQKLIQRHEGFRTSFHIIDGNPLQKIHEDVEFKIAYYDLGNRHEAIGNREKTDYRTMAKIEDKVEEGDKIHHFIRPFDLSQVPLLRVGLIKIEEGKHILMVDMHHIISDGISHSIFIKEFTAIFRGETLPPLPVQYKEYSMWQRKSEDSEALKKQETYWLKEFQGEIPLANLPLDYPRPHVQSFEGDSITVEAEKGLIGRLKKLADEIGTTLFMVLIAAYNVLLFRYTGQEDIVVGIPTGGRLHPDLQNIIGMFANTIALRNVPHLHQTFTEFLEKVKEKLLKAFKNQDYQFERLIDKLNYQREAGRNPLFDTMFVLQNMDIEEWEIEDLKITPYDYERQRSTFDISIEGFEKDDAVVFYLEYCTRLFKRETIEKMTVHFRNILKIVAENPYTRLSEIEMATEEEREQILVQFSTVTDGGQYDFD